MDYSNNMGVLQAQAEKLNNEQLKAWKSQQDLTSEQWQRIKNHVQSVRKLERYQNAKRT
jgi:hypothetical protein